MKIGIIGGTGIGERLLEELGSGGARQESVETPFGRPSAPITVAGLDGASGGDGVEIALLPRHGVAHEFPPHRVPYRANVYAMKALGVTHLVATAACGSLRDAIEPGHVALVDQVIDRTVHRDRTFFDDLAVHVEFAEPMCGVTRSWLGAAAERAGVDCHARATYVCMDGPGFSTRAESEMHRQLGGDVIGMTALPEARLAREAEMAYALIALPTDFDCWRPREASGDDEALLTEIIGNLNRAGDAALALVAEALGDVGALRDQPSEAHRALDHALWTQRDAIAEAIWDRYGPLLDRIGGRRV